MRAPRIARAAAAVLALEALALAVVVAVELTALVSGGATSMATAVALIVLTALCAVALALFAIGVLRGRSIARSGAVVLHVLALILALAALTIDPPVHLFAVAVGVPAIVGLVLLLASARVEGRAEGGDGADAASDPDSGAA